MLVSRSQLTRVIKTLDDFDASGSPFAGLQWGKDTPLFHRAGPAGFIQSRGYEQRAPDMIISIPHFKAMLARFPDDALRMVTDKNGVLVLRSADSTLDTTFHVHTVRQNITWAKWHVTGKRTVALDPTGFSGINTQPFNLTSPPVLRQNRLMLVTGSGVIFRDAVPVEAYPYPRESFLRTISPLSVQELSLSEFGYWCASTEEFEVVMSGHRSGDPLFDFYNRKPEVQGELPAARLTWALAQAASIAGKTAVVTVDPATGVSARDIYGHEDKMSLGNLSGWDRFVIPPQTAATIADVLKQASEETVQLGHLMGDMRCFTRGKWTINFQAVTP